MKLNINIVSVHGVAPSASGERKFPDNTSVSQLIELLDLPVEDVYAIMVNEIPAPPDTRDDHVLVDGDKVTIFPPIQGG